LYVFIADVAARIISVIRRKLGNAQTDKEISMKVLATAAMSLSLLDPVGAQTNEAKATTESATNPPAFVQTLSISRSGSRPPSQGSTDYFTGSVRVDPLFRTDEPARASGAYVTFAPGAHSAWHTHPLGQTLIVTAGVGRVQRWDRPIEEIRSGDVVWIPPGVKHWHGAAPNSAMTHIAIQEQQGGKTVDWLEKVSDAQYNDARVPAAPNPAAGASTASAPQSTPAQRLLGDIAPKLAELTDNVLFGDVWARPGLSRRDRSLVTVSALIAMNRPDQLRSHLALARQNGVTQDELVEALTHLAFYAGWPSAVTAASVAREVFSKP
jgi:4-carboxymuconolactone decarboxylase